MAEAEGHAGRQSELEPVVSLVDVLEEDEELEKEACAVLGGSDSEKCSYSQVGTRPGPRLPRVLPNLPSLTAALSSSRPPWPPLSPGGLGPPSACPPTSGPAVFSSSPVPARFFRCVQQGPPFSCLRRLGFSRLWPWSCWSSLLSSLFWWPECLSLHPTHDLLNPNPDVFVTAFPS